MRRSGIFWGGMFVIVGLLLLLWTMGYIDVNIWQLIWPIALVLMGVIVLLGTTGIFGKPEVEQVTIPLEGAGEAHIVVEHGVGEARLTGPAEPGVLVSGSFGGGLNSRRSREGDRVRLKMKRQEFVFPFFWPGQSSDLTWEFTVTREVPVSMKIQGGAGIVNFDMRELRLTDLKVDGSVGMITLTMPAHAGQTTTKIDGGVGTVTVNIPENVAARIRTDQGIGTVNVDQNRFPRVDGRYYQSASFDTAENRLDIKIDAGVGTVTVH